jgi:hypothetical protein
MSEADAGTSKQPDPMEQFRELRDAYLDIWSKNLTEVVNTEGYAQASGAALDSYLTVAAPFKEPTEQAMLKILQQLNMPTSADFASLAGRFTNIEMLLDNLDAKQDRIENLLTGLKAAMPAEARLDHIEKLLTSLKAATPAEARLDHIEKLLTSLKAATPAEARLDQIEKLLTGLKAATPTEARLDRIENLLTGLKAATPTETTKSAAQTAPVKHVVAVSPEVPARASAPSVAKTTAKAAPYNSRKGKR